MSRHPVQHPGQHMSVIILPGSCNWYGTRSAGPSSSRVICINAVSTVLQFTLQPTKLCNKLLNLQQAQACNKPFHTRSCCVALLELQSVRHESCKLSTAANNFCKWARPQKVVMPTCCHLHYRLTVWDWNSDVRNLNADDGLCNGTRLMCHASRDRRANHQWHLLQMKHVHSMHSANFTWLQFAVIMPFTLCRQQFPIRLCYCMTMNKEYVGLYQPRPVFSHGQLYIGLSRAGSADRI